MTSTTITPTATTTTARQTRYLVIEGVRLGPVARHHDINNNNTNCNNNNNNNNNNNSKTDKVPGHRRRQAGPCCAS